MIKIWEIEFNSDYSSWVHVRVTAPNVKEAMQKALSRTKGNYYNRVQDIRSINLVAKTNLD